jgi:hypothetical protein
MASGDLTAARDARWRSHYHGGMRSMAVYLTLLVLLIVSIGAGFIASDWPRWCRWAHWCAANWPPSH